MKETFLGMVYLTTSLAVVILMLYIFGKVVWFFIDMIYLATMWVIS